MVWGHTGFAPVRRSGVMPSVPAGGIQSVVVHAIASQQSLPEAEQTPAKPARCGKSPPVGARIHQLLRVTWECFRQTRAEPYRNERIRPLVTRLQPSIRTKDSVLE